MPATITPAQAVRAAAVLTAAALAAAGCSSGGPPAVAVPGPVVVAVGAHANAAGPELVPRLQETLLQAVTAGVDVPIVVGGAKPRPVAVRYLHDAMNSDAKAAETAANVAKLRQVLRTARANSAETDPLALVATAERLLPDGGGTVLVVDSALQTAGALKFQENNGMLLAADPAEVAAYLHDSGQLPDLTGAQIVWSGLGDVAAPQPELTAAARANLQAVWQTVLTRAGATVTFLDDPLTAPVPDDLPKVSVVPIADPLPFTAGGAHTAPTSVDLDERTIAFEADSARLRDPDAARQVLAPLAELITAHRLTVVLTGTTSSAGTADGRRKLSLGRATAVKEQLVGLGIDASRITVRGNGSDGPGQTVDRDRHGRLMPGPAARNRRVVVALSAS